MLHEYDLALLFGLDTAALKRNPNFPPYNIERTSDDDYVIPLAVAGFSEENLEVTASEGRLEIVGRIADKQEGRTFIHQRLAFRDFRQVFNLAPHVEVTDTTLKNGLLRIALRRNVPEKYLPKRIAIATA